MKDQLGREIHQGDILAYVGFHPYGTPCLDLATVIDGCSFALKLEKYPKPDAPDDPWVISEGASYRYILVKRYVATQADI